VSDESTVTPRQVDGFLAAQAIGLLPRVPELPPSPLPRRTARRAFVEWLLCVAMGGLSWVLFASVFAGPLNRSWPVAGPVLLVMGAVGVFVLCFLRPRARAGEVFLDELTAGYTTLPMLGAFWGLNPRRAGGNYMEPWDFRGVWVLDGGGEVRSAPDRTVDPPGLYPSPDRPGQLQVWTGVEWARKFRAPARPFATEPAQPQP
jgi:hypothetical protein